MSKRGAKEVSKASQAIVRLLWNSKVKDRCCFMLILEYVNPGRGRVSKVIVSLCSLLTLHGLEWYKHYGENSKVLREAFDRVFKPHAASDIQSFFRMGGWNQPPQS